MPADYKTLKASACDEIIINKSRFIGYGCPCATEDEALSFLKSIREKHKDATHNCYAYIIGENSGIMRYSDDGEPSGTAGLPMMETLKQVGVVNLCVVVTRYFGGILLGAGGLVRAYRKGTEIALRAAQIVTMRQSERYLVEIAYPQWDKVNYALKALPVLQEETEFSASVSVNLLMRVSDAPQILEKLSQLTDGKAEFVKTDMLYYPWPDEDALSQVRE